MTKQNADLNKRRLISRLAFDPLQGEVQHVLATTFDFNSDFFETDLFPSILGLGTWDDRKWASRIALEKKLLHIESASVFVEARRYNGRPRSLRLEVVPVMRRSAGVLHAKIALIVREKCLQCIVSSANLTDFGYRKNREIATLLTVREGDVWAAPMIHAALRDLRAVLEPWWTPSAEITFAAASRRLQALGSHDANENVWCFIGGLEKRLWESFIERWPADEPVDRISIVSPFWAERPEEGFVDEFISALRSRKAAVNGTELRLFAEAQPIGGGEYAAVLPAPYGAFDFGTLDIRAFAYPVDPGVLPEEVEGISGYVATRPLHAKVLAMEGPKSILVYTGSANFTRNGWGFGIDPKKANIEAGLITLFPKQNREVLRTVIPAHVGEPIPLQGKHQHRIVVPEKRADDPAWPPFLRDVRLAQSKTDSAQLELRISIDSAECTGSWKVMSLAEGDKRTLLLEQDTPTTTLMHSIALSEDSLNHLMKSQEVLVSWWSCPKGVRVPLNVDIEARESLPIAPGSSKPNENDLIAYYQGRISWEDLFPDPDAPSESGNGTSPESQESGVDTSAIQSYQIREFVEALPGILSDIRSASGSARAFRFALMGPVSPLSIAREIVAAVRRQHRTPTAAGFQLVEILACLAAAENHTVPDERHDGWKSALAVAQSQIESLLVELERDHPAISRSRDSAFSRYARAVLGNSAGAPN